MMSPLRPPFTPIPAHLEPLYLKLRITLAVLIGIAGAGIAYTFLFPTILTSFDFRNPKSSRNQVFDPRNESGLPRTNGKLENGGTLFADTSPLGDFSELSVEVNLEKRSEIPNQIDVRIRKGYRAFRYPVGETISDFPEADLYHVGRNYYRLQDGTLRPFVSDAAFLSRYPAAIAREESPEWQSRYPVAAEFIGFRVGSLISFADGVYVVTSDTDIRPIGSAEIFLAFGYRFDDVIAASGEDLGIYKRGRIFLMGAPHPDGTLFLDQSSDTLYLIESGMRRPIEKGAYHDFLASAMHPIPSYETDSVTATHCMAVTGLLPRTLRCTSELAPIRESAGPDYEIALSGQDETIDIATITLAFDTRLDRSNLRTLLAKVKQRIFARFGLVQ